MPDGIGHAFSVCCEAVPASLDLTVLVDAFPLPPALELVEEIPTHVS
jgi:hypothetical protein